MSAAGSIAKSLELEFNALEGSLNIMSKVLNDVLDFNRLDSGKLESLSKPYAFHQVMRSMFLPLRLATDARKLELIIDLDMNIDEVARRGAYRALGKDSESIETLLKEEPSGESHYGIVVGDETRLRQVVTNLASNACKFTPAGGKLTIRTRLIFPNVTSDSETEQQPKSDSENTLTMQNIERHNQSQGSLHRIVVRIEITDTGSGIPPKDMIHSKLFSAFNQTEQGRLQGGKGTGLGLALVRLIVKLSGGRLGVRSKVGQGSTFWVSGVASWYWRGAMLAVEDTAVLSPSIQNLTSKALLQSTQQRRNSVYSFTDGADNVRCPTLAPSSSLRSKQALHRLMDQGGSVELNLANYDSHSAVPTRMIGDRSTGSDIPLPYLTREDSSRSNLTTSQAKSEEHDDSDNTSEIRMTAKRYTSRPNRVPLPSPNAYPFDSESLLADKTFSVSAPSTPSFNQPLNVLVVDDDGLTRTLMKRMLERMGCVVTTAENGSLALDILLSRESDTKSSLPSPGNSEMLPRNSEHSFNIVFLDNQMPVLGGLKVVARLRDLGREDFVVGVTGNALVTDQQEYLAAGVDQSV
ncbi:hypothetical protein D9757_011734 [Collybiopsis confluens]|uniref:histidine kinase n=1 Tax=Collybiopsis confluens TaxID=2823264 RepID=A0A8H5LJY3_9AGAR|nr:hypothetical protein D9757_011734 [Collybiopsis confluens]